MIDHNKFPSSEKSAEKCILRKSNFHQILPTHDLIFVLLSVVVDIVMLCVVGKFSSMNSSAFQRTKYQNFMRPGSIDSYNSDWLITDRYGLTFSIEWASACCSVASIGACAVYWWYLYLVPIIDIIVSLPRSSQLNIKTESSATQQQQGEQWRSCSKNIQPAGISSPLD